MMLDTSKFNLKTIKNNGKSGVFEMSPLVGGFGHTVGEGLRRTLLITIPGAAITRIKVDGASHLYSTIAGVKEDLVEISLNLKKIKFSLEGNEPMTLTLSKKGEGVITAADIKDSSSCKVVNPDQHIATLTDSKAKLNIELTIEKGVGYTMAREQTTSTIGEIILDAMFTPVTKVNYAVEPARVGKKSNYDKLTLEVTTDGSIDPQEAIKRAAADLIFCYSQIVDPKEYKEEVITINIGGAQQAGEDISVEEIELPLRVTNALKKAGFSNIAELTKGGRSVVSKSKNVGEKSLKVIDAWLAERSYKWSDQ